jgi:hypothetical protein
MRRKSNALGYLGLTCAAIAGLFAVNFMLNVAHEIDQRISPPVVCVITSRGAVVCGEPQ